MNIQSENQNLSLGNGSMKSPAKSIASTLASTKVQSSPNELNFTRIGTWRINMEISPKRHHESPVYSIDVSGLFSDNTEITLYTSPKKDDRVLGRCRFNKFRPSEMQISSNGGASSRMTWIQHHECYRWSIPRKSQAGEKAGEQEEKYFSWKTVEEPASPKGNHVYQNLELCDMDDVIYAAYSGGAPGTKNGGNLRLRDDLDEEFLAMIVLTVCGLIEKERQARARKGNYTIGMLAY
ncbi:hypothetical protein PENSUB_9624 [Penicillium subrubescens]|uniref:Uncharacterized protein n=2 Tax=Penicillium subrubescens TaxID=1316194 RepID=A0A1Q5TCU5_9EURO|nr:hypothetical protein PENSUB_9624 [Penicillium subrubescens]